MSVEKEIANIPFIRNLQMASEAHEEMDLDPLFEIMDPKEDSREMGRSFMNVIGYNPITYYTEKAASDVFFDTKEMLAEYPKTVEKLKEIEESVIAELVDHTETTRAQYAYFGIKGKIRNMIRELGEVPNSKLDEVMDALERKYNLNYKERKPVALDNPKPIDSFDKKEENYRKDHDRGTSFQNTREHPVKLRGLPDDEDVDELHDLERTDFSLRVDDEDTDDDKLVFPDDDEDDEDDSLLGYSYDDFDDEDEPRLKSNDYFI